MCTRSSQASKSLPIAVWNIDCKTVSSFAWRSRIRARSSYGKLGRGNKRADESNKEWGEGLKEETVALQYFKSVLQFCVPQETQNSHWSVFHRSCQSHSSKTVDLRLGLGRLNMKLMQYLFEKLSGFVLKVEKSIYSLIKGVDLFAVLPTGFDKTSVIYKLFVEAKRKQSATTELSPLFTLSEFDLSAVENFSIFTHQ